MTNQHADPTRVEFAFPANVPGFNPKCPDCQVLIGASAPDQREYTLFHDDSDGRGHDLCPSSISFIAGGDGLLGDGWVEEDLLGDEAEDC